jgi:hypothetical protein
MKPPDKKLPQTGGAVQQPERPATAAHQFRPAVAQSKGVASARARRPPVAPPAYRPQPARGAAQAKAAQAKPAALKPEAGAPRVVAPPVYRPRNGPRVLQPKTAGGPPGAAHTPRQPVAPPVYRPEHKKIVQLKEGVPARGEQQWKDRGCRMRPCVQGHPPHERPPVAQRKLGPVSQPAQLKVAPGGRGPGWKAGVVQLKLDQEVKINTFMEDLKADKSNKDLKGALTALLAEAKNSKLDIKYSWLVDKVNSKGLNPSKIRKLKNELEALVAHELEEELSGKKGHMMSRHVFVDKKFQEERLSGGLAKATRVAFSGKEGEKYVNYIKGLKESAPEKIKEHVTNVAHNVLLHIKEAGGTYKTATNNPGRKTAVDQSLASMDMVEEADDHTINFAWTSKIVQPPGAGAVPTITLTCDPTITSRQEFRKTATETGRDKKTVENQEYAPVIMYWGSNKIKLEGITDATTEGQLQNKIDELNFMLGVTQF